MKLSWLLPKFGGKRTMPEVSKSEFQPQAHHSFALWTQANHVPSPALNLFHRMRRLDQRPYEVLLVQTAQVPELIGPDISLLPSASPAGLTPALPVVWCLDLLPYWSQSRDWTRCSPAATPLCPLAGLSRLQRWPESTLSYPERLPPICLCLQGKFNPRGPG